MKYLKVWTDLAKAIEPLGDAEKGRLFTAMLEYANRGAEPEFRGNERFIWPTVKSEIDRQIAAYQHQCTVNKANVTNRYESLRTVTNRCESLQDKDKDKKKKREEEEKTLFVPPTVEDVAAYCKARNNSINAEEFVNFYASKGWMIGKNRMKDWQAAIRTWEQARKKKAEQELPPPKADPYSAAKAFFGARKDVVDI